MDLADDIAYSTYDLEDTLEAGIVSPFDLMSIDDETLNRIHEKVSAKMTEMKIAIPVTRASILETLTDAFATLVSLEDPTYDLQNHRHRLAFVGRTYLESIEHAKNPLIRRQYLETMIERSIDGVWVDVNEPNPSLSTLRVDPDCLFRIECMKAFNFFRVISSRRLKMQHFRSKKIIHDLFGIFESDRKGDLFSESLRRARLSIPSTDKLSVARLIADFISSLTDGEAVRLHEQLRSSRSTPFTAYWR